jgi:hypothetical protein
VRIDQRADKARPAVARALQSLQQEAIVGSILRAALRLAIGCGQVDRGVVGGNHARRSAEHIDAQAAVVGDRRTTTGARGVPRLGECVFEEGGVRLLGLDNAERALGHEFELER